MQIIESGVHTNNMTEFISKTNSNTPAPADACAVSLLEEMLPPEMLAHICEFLDTAGRIRFSSACRHTRAAVTDLVKISVGGRTLQSKVRRRLRHDHTLADFLNEFSAWKVERLFIAHVYESMDFNVPRMQYLRDLTVFKGRPDLKNLELKNIPQGLRRLRLGYWEEEDTPKTLVKLPEHWPPQLKRLHLDNVAIVDSIPPPPKTLINVRLINVELPSRGGADICNFAHTIGISDVNGNAPIIRNRSLKKFVTDKSVSDIECGDLIMLKGSSIYGENKVRQIKLWPRNGVVEGAGFFSNCVDEVTYMDVCNLEDIPRVFRGGIKILTLSCKIMGELQRFSVDVLRICGNQEILSKSLPDAKTFKVSKRKISSDFSTMAKCERAIFKECTFPCPSFPVWELPESATMLRFVECTFSDSIEVQDFIVYDSRVERIEFVRCALAAPVPAVVLHPRTSKRIVCCHFT